MNKIFEKIFYSFGTNISGYNVQEELDCLSKNLPKSYQNRNVIDLGCGDGKITLRLAPILKPKSTLGVDISKTLLKTAQKRGLNIKVLDIEKQEISGDLGIMWGVLHHLENPVKTLKKVKKNFKNLIIRESIKKKRFFEIGNKFNQKELKKILKKANIKTKKIIKIPKNQSLIILI